MKWLGGSIVTDNLDDILIEDRKLANSVKLGALVNRLSRLSNQLLVACGGHYEVIGNS
jgi:hypothetical protein